MRPEEYLVALLRTRPPFIPVSRCLVLYFDERLCAAGYVLDIERSKGDEFWYRRVDDPQE